MHRHLVYTLLLCTALANAVTVQQTTTITQTVALATSTSTSLAPSETTNKSTTQPSASIMPHGIYSGADFSSAVLNSTNFFRAQFLASPVEWDATLAQFAQKHAQACIWEHSGGPYGENLAEGFATPALAVDAWAVEEKHYQYPDGGFSESTGHFTQLVWSNTTHVGCGAVNCGSGTSGDAAFGWYLVCEYAPAGNVEGEYRWNVRKPGESNGQLGFGQSSAASRKVPGRGLRSLMGLLALVWLVGVWV